MSPLCARAQRLSVPGASVPGMDGDTLIRAYWRTCEKRDWEAFEDGLITEIDDFWPEPYDPPVREAPVVRRY